MSDKELYDQFLEKYPAFDDSHWTTFGMTIVIFLVVVFFTPGTLADQFRSLLASPPASFIKEKLNVPHQFPLQRNNSARIPRD